jgi:hypothetical protein
MYKYGIKGWLRLCWTDGWRYFILAFFDVEGNYFTVLAYQYTTILSAQLINFWAIAVVVAISFTLLKVRYHVLQIVGILICCGGLGVLVASDHITGSNSGTAKDAVKGDLFALLGATCYGLSNVAQEFLVSKKPLYEVIGQLAWWAMFINGVQAGIFDRKAFQDATWNSKQNRKKRFAEVRSTQEGLSRSQAKLRLSLSTRTLFWQSARYLSDGNEIVLSHLHVCFSRQPLSGCLIVHYFPQAKDLQSAVRTLRLTIE